jgi:hypothetical protein
MESKRFWRMLLDIHHNPVSRCRDLAKDYEEYVHAVPASMNI